MSWSTASEINNDFFTVEKSIDGHIFESIRQVAGAGFSTTVKNYSIYDRNPVSGISYYRLKQTDYDCNFEYSKVVAKLYKPKEASLTYYTVNNNLEIIAIGLNGSEATIDVYTTMGMLLLHKKHPVVNGVLNLTIDIGTKILSEPIIIRISDDMEVYSKILAISSCNIFLNFIFYNY